MTKSPDLGGHFPRHLAGTLGALAKALALIVLVGRGTSPEFWSGFPLSSLEALCFLLLGSGLLFQAVDIKPLQSILRRVVWVVCCPAIFLGALALFGVSPIAESMTFAVALSTILIGIVLLFPDFEPWPTWRPLQGLLLPVLWAGLLGCVAHVYGATTSNTFTAFLGISVVPALGFMILAIGVIGVRPHVGIAGVIFNPRVGGTMARILLPVVLILPFTVGWLRVKGIRLGHYDTNYGYAHFSTTNILFFAFFIWASARILNQIDEKRRVALNNVQDGNVELKRLNASLEAKIRQHYVAEEARKKAEMQLFQSQKMEALGTLASGIAHDFNNILTIILLNSDIAAESLPEGHPVRQNLAEIDKAGNRAADLIRRIMTFGQHTGSELKTLRIEKVILEAINILQPSFPPDIRILSDLGGTLPAVNANHSHIEQVIINLGANAAHAMGKEGGTLEIRLEAVAITSEKAALSAQLREGNYVRITVSDSGHGMDAHTLKNIFNPFYTTKAPGEGTGLGLSVVHGIMKLHGGAITVYSEPNRGTVFSLYFPTATGHTVVKPIERIETPRGTGQHILCVDDDDSLVAAVSTMLTHLGYTTTVHRYPLEAIEDFRSHPGKYDAVLTDFSMPEMSGLALARALVEISPGIPLVMMSGYLRPEDAEEAARAGIKQVLLKPDVPEKLGEVIHRLLR